MTAPATALPNRHTPACPPAPMRGGVTVVIVNWNSGPLLAQSVQSLREQTVEPSAVFVVDNASTDDSLVRLPAWDRLTVLRMDSNLGFAAGNNQAIALCQTEYIALLNPDAFAAPDWLEQLLCAAQAHPGAAAFGSRQLCHENPALLDGTGDCYHWSGMAWRESHGQPQTPVRLYEQDIFAPCAAAALYRHGAVQAVGGFDERYFCYFEDVDLGFRLRLAGHTARYVPGAVVRHVGSATTGGQRSEFATFHGHRNMAWTFVKNMPGILFWALLPLHLVAHLAGCLLLAARGQARAAARARWHALCGLRTAWRQRQAIQRDRKASIASIWRALDKRLWPRPR